MLWMIQQAVLTHAVCARIHTHTYSGFFPQRKSVLFCLFVFPVEKFLLFFFFSKSNQTNPFNLKKLMSTRSPVNLRTPVLLLHCAPAAVRLRCCWSRGCSACCQCCARHCCSPRLAATWGPAVLPLLPLWERGEKKWGQEKGNGKC